MPNYSLIETEWILKRENIEDLWNDHWMLLQIDEFLKFPEPSLQFKVHQQIMSDEFISKHNNSYSSFLYDPKETVEFPEARLITPLNQRGISIQIEQSWLIIYYDLETASDDPHFTPSTASTDFFPYWWKTYKPLGKALDISEITLLFKRRFLLKNSSVLVFLKSCRSLTIDF